MNLETFGGNVPVIHISAKYGQNIDLLQELILFEIELLNLKTVKLQFLYNFLIFLNFVA